MHADSQGGSASAGPAGDADPQLLLLEQRMEQQHQHLQQLQLQHHQQHHNPSFQSSPCPTPPPAPAAKLPWPPSLQPLPQAAPHPGGAPAHGGKQGRGCTKTGKKTILMPATFSASYHCDTQPTFLSTPHTLFFFPGCGAEYALTFPCANHCGRRGGPPASALHKPHGPETWQQHNDRRSHCRDGRRGRRRGRRGGGGAQRGVRHAGGACGCGFVCRWDGDCARVVAGSARPTHHRIHTPPRTQTGGVSEDHLPPRYISPMARRLGSSTTTAAATAAMEDAGGGGGEGGGGAQRGVRHAGGACGCGFVCRWDGDCARVVAGSARPTHHRIHTPPRTQTGGVSEDHLPPRYISPMARRLGSSTTTAAATAAMEDAGGGGGEGEGEERNEVSVMPGVRVDVGLCVDGMGTVPALLPAPHARHTTASTHPHAHRLAACRRTTCLRAT